MAIFRKLHTSFWQDGKVIEELTPEDKKQKSNDESYVIEFILQSLV